VAADGSLDQAGRHPQQMKPKRGTFSNMINFSISPHRSRMLQKMQITKPQQIRLKRKTLSEMIDSVSAQGSRMLWTLQMTLSSVAMKTHISMNQRLKVKHWMMIIQLSITFVEVCYLL
jgi:hypothetical protein